ncbi:HTH domain-containing protein [Chryseobacterium sp. Ch-15]|uniref:HTH domain-containing protein n=1 Tax=Chryseobacterium muglaense TaxID=2893752 RepID=A0A9Q3YQM3_9FLAO|nr:HTH domain-containing protein [Chryseobacterium muglaense]MCC9033173.1 HTH domain-containing protein [Chryseobacterium muglaense]MCM2556111.1 HTH domain-containing protein [Chryseobacterium muglaense]
MIENDTKRLSRLTSILLQLQTKRLITSTELSDKFSVSKRTI